MKRKVLLQIFLWCTALVLARIFAGPLVFAPALELPHTKRLTHEWELHLDDLQIMVNDWDLTEMVLLGFTMDVDLSQVVVVTDTYLELEDGCPVSLDREFDVISQDLEISTQAGGWSGAWNETERVYGSSELEGTLVQFRWDQEEYQRAFHPADQAYMVFEDAALLEGLTEDMDLRLLLPNEVVEVGDTWDIELARLPDLFSPGGYFAWQNELGGTGESLLENLDPALMGDLRHVLGEMLCGEATVTYVAEIEGLSELEIFIDVYTLQGDRDLVDVAARILGADGAMDSLVVEGLTVDLSLRARGTARWDSRWGHVHDLEMSGEMESQMQLAFSLDWGASVYRVTVATEVSGEWLQGFEVR